MGARGKAYGFLGRSAFAPYAGFEKGYEAKCRHIDQPPFHKNEAGSVTHSIIVMQGVSTVPLIENHVATRELWNLDSVTDSSEDRIKKSCPSSKLCSRQNAKFSKPDCKGVLPPKTCHSKYPW